MIVEKTLPPPPVHPTRTVPSPRAEAPPPPYTPNSYRDVSPSFPTPESDIHSVNHIHIYNRHEDIVGTYCIDPTKPLPNNFKGKSRWRASTKTPNASFRTRRAPITINLATTGTTLENNRSYVQATTRKGEININLYSLLKGKHINLDVSSRHGRILVLIPRSFAGAIQLKSRKGGYKILPALSSASRVLTANDREALILVGHPSSMPTSSTSTTDDLTTDFCQLASRNGKVIIGFTGEDKYVRSETGIWQKLGELLGIGGAPVTAS